MYQFTDDCLIGIPQIDEEHRHLFQLINAAFDTLQAEEDDCVILTKNLIVKLQDYAKNHFLHEEAYMESIQDPELPRQRREHAEFTEKINEFAANQNMDKKALNDLLVFLTRWLYRHILSSDMMIGKIRKCDVKDGSENPFEFSEKYHTGIEMIDNEHRELFSIISETNELIHAELLHDKYDKIMEILAKLRVYTETHFKDEEEYMQSIQYADLDAQKRAHTAFIEKLVEIDLSELDEMDDNQQEYLEELIDFLAGWLINHILKMDKRIGK